MGPYDNETESYIADPAVMNAAWFTTDDGVLVIIAGDGDTDDFEAYGPDGFEGYGPDFLLDPLFDRLQQGTSLVDAAVALRLTAVPDTLRRFSSEIGYYSA